MSRRPVPRRPRAVGGLLTALVLVLLLAAAACGGPRALDAAPAGTDPGAAAADPSAGRLQGDLVVLAAASLTDSVAAMAAQLQAQHPDLRVTTSFAGSSQLAQQVVAGAPADVLATASSQTMAVVTDAGLTRGEPRLMARNVLVLAVPAGNPGGVDGLDDLADPDLLVGLCQPQVPCGAASAQLLAEADVQARPDTLEQDVRGVLSKLALAELDAGLVYRTDVLQAAGAVTSMEVPGAEDAANDYLVASLATAPNPRAAAAFVDLALSEQGRRVLAADGFRLP